MIVVDISLQASWSAHTHIVSTSACAGVRTMNSSNDPLLSAPPYYFSDYYHILSVWACEYCCWHFLSIMISTHTSSAHQLALRQESVLSLASPEWPQSSCMLYKIVRGGGGGGGLFRQSFRGLQNRSGVHAVSTHHLVNSQQACNLHSFCATNLITEAIFLLPILD